MRDTALLTLVLAAGKGTRMRSRHPKVLHKIAGLSMLGHVLHAARDAGAGTVGVVVGPDMEAVAAEARRLIPSVGVFIQPQQLGTADAVKAATPALTAHGGDVIVMFADVPLISAATIERMRTRLDGGADVVVLGFRPLEPFGYGRLITTADGEVVAIREERDASAEERAIGHCNAGAMAFRVPDLPGLLSRISTDNMQKEFYLTDVVPVARSAGLRTAWVDAPADEVLGINSRAQLAQAEHVWQWAKRRQVMAEGATLIAPETVWFSFDTRVGQDVVIEPNVVFGVGVTIEDDAEIKANCYFEGAHIRRGARVGPFARLRPGADLGENVHIGNFVEVKNSTIAKGAKANHLSYLGDSTVGSGANIGAGTIFCNYDGFNKHRTVVGEGAFVGSNTSLVAPVTIGAGAYIGSGSVITKNVPDNALALERTAQETREGWAQKFRSVMARQKAGKSG